MDFDSDSAYEAVVVVVDTVGIVKTAVACGGIVGRTWDVEKA